MQAEKWNVRLTCPPPATHSSRTTLNGLSRKARSNLEYLMVNILRNDINKSKFSLDDVMLSLKGPVPTLSFLEEEKKRIFRKKRKNLPSAATCLSTPVSCLQCLLQIFDEEAIRKPLWTLNKWFVLHCFSEHREGELHLALLLVLRLALASWFIQPQQGPIWVAWYEFDHHHHHYYYHHHYHHQYHRDC